MRKSTSLRINQYAALACLSLVTTAALVSTRNTKSSAQEPQVCPYTVRAGSWVATSVRLSKGQKASIKATGTMRYAEGARIEFGPGGDMYGVWSLKAKIGSQIVDLPPSAWIITAEQDGPIELGVPARANTPVEEGAKFLDMNYSLCVSVTIIEEVGAIRAELRDVPTEVWVGWGRPSMSATVFITGFRRNTADPVMLECKDATNGFGDHPFASDRLKTVRIFPCGATAQTYDWPAEGYAWGIMISAPARDTENDQQPGRPRDICIGTNPVRITVSQKGAGSATVTIAPQLVLKQGLVGGGGTYGASNCSGDQRGAGGTGSGGGGTGGNLRGRFALQTMNGNYLTAVNGGGIQGPGAINSDATKISGWETFEVEPQPDGKYAIKTMNGNYLTAMRGGGVTGADAIHSDGRRIDAWEKFTLQPQSDGTYAIQTADGNYISAVNGGGIGGGRGAIHTDATTVRGWEKFKLVAAGKSEGSVDYESSSSKGSAYQWVSTGVGDCSGQDIGQSSGSGQPTSSECNAATVGTVAICWDGRTYSNGGSRSWCTYKNTGDRPCRGGGNPGFAFQCQAR
jgi:hypothetical protein